MAAFFDFLSASAKIWLNNPLESGVAVFVGIVAGYVLSGIRHQGTIQAQKERLEHKDDLIKFKDTAIAAASATAPRSDPSPPSQTTTPPTIPPAPAQQERQPVQSSGDPRFASLNAKIIEQTEKDISSALNQTIYKLVFNPQSGQNKKITFLSNGEIGDGRNPNENRWRISHGRLEILNSKDEIYSRFFLLPDKQTFHHTNDPDTLSIKGQYMNAVGQFKL